MSGAQIDAPPATEPDELAPIRDAGALTGHGLSDLRRIALDVVAAGIRAADPATAVSRTLTRDGSWLRAGAWQVDLDAIRSVVVLGAGKASMPIAAELEQILGDRISRGLVIRRRGAPGDLECIEVADADHPLPTRSSLVAGQRLLELAATVAPDELVITAFTGGSSALACVPAEGVPFEAKHDLHRMLLDSGASIADVNAVRKHVSDIKGGRLASRMNGAKILNLTISDVVGDRTDLVCDPVVQDTSTPDDAVEVLQRLDLWDAVAPEIRRHLTTSSARSPQIAGALDVTTFVLTNGDQIVEHMAERVRALGCDPVVVGSTLEGEASALGAVLGSLALESSRRGRPFRGRSVLVSAGGEATVTIHPPTSGVGEGGPNQEVAVSFARSVARHPTAVAGVFVDSDGSDGGTTAAGGCVDSLTWSTAQDQGVDLVAALARHDTLAALAALDDLVVTGQTGTNVSDIWAIALESCPGDTGAGQ
jgi:glycerate-2-kinase